MKPYVYVEFPKWLHREGHKSVLVQDAEEQGAQFAAWGAPATPAVALNSLTAAAAPPRMPEASSVLPKAKGGWPKGKPRKAAAATVN